MIKILITIIKGICKQITLQSIPKWHWLISQIFDIMRKVCVQIGILFSGCLIVCGQTSRCCDVCVLMFFRHIVCIRYDYVVTCCYMLWCGLIQQSVTQWEWMVWPVLWQIFVARHGVICMSFFLSLRNFYVKMMYHILS